MWTVPVTVAHSDWQDVQLGHESLAQDDGEPLIVSYVLRSIGKVTRRHEAITHLYLGYDDPPGLLIQPLVVPVGVEVGELLGESVVFPDPDRVVDSEAGLLVTPAVPCNVIVVVLLSVKIFIVLDCAATVIVNFKIPIDKNDADFKPLD